MTSKTDGTYTATYAYRYGDKLGSVTSDFPGEGTVTYEYGGDQKRRERSVSGGDYAWYNWDIGWNVINEEHSNGTLSKTYTMNSPVAQVAGILADASTTNPATGTYRYYNQDNLGSTRRLRASDKSALGAYEYTPYGQAYATSGVALGDLAGAFTGKAWDDTSQLYYFPHRYYSPDAARWLTRDPLGMVEGGNIYAYVQGDPVALSDMLGLYGDIYIKRGITPLCGVNAGHEWLECSSEPWSVGFWPNRNWQVLSPDPYDGAWGPDIIQWETKKRNYGKMKWGPAAGRSCADATPTDVQLCLNAVPDPKWKHFALRNNCRRYVRRALKGCCLTRGSRY